MPGQVMRTIPAADKDHPPSRCPPQKGADHGPVEAFAPATCKRMENEIQLGGIKASGKSSVREIKPWFGGNRDS
jgi:hypothetical protein